MRRVLIPEKPGSVLFHDPDCKKVNRDRAAELAESDARDIGRRPAPCVTREDDGPDPNEPESNQGAITA